MTNRSALIGSANHARAPLYPTLWQSPEFFWNFSLGDGAHVHDYTGQGRDGAITAGIESNQFFNDTDPIQLGLRCLRRTGSGGHIEAASYPSFRHEVGVPWSVICRFSVSDTAGDDRAIFAFRPPGGIIQLLIRTDLGAAPQNIEVYINSNLRISAADNIELNTGYVLSVTNDGLKISTSLRLRLYNALTGENIQTMTNPSGTTNIADLDGAEWWIGASDSDTNDPLIGTHCGAYVYSRVLDDSEIQLFVDDWLAPFRVKRRAIGLVAAGGDGTDFPWPAPVVPPTPPVQVVGY